MPAPSAAARALGGALCLGVLSLTACGAAPAPPGEANVLGPVVSVRNGAPIAVTVVPWDGAAPFTVPPATSRGLPRGGGPPPPWHIRILAADGHAVYDSDIGYGPPRTIAVSLSGGLVVDTLQFDDDPAAPGPAQP